MANPLILENEGLTVAFDAETGALVGILCSKTGWQIHRRRNLGMSFSMLVPLPGQRHHIVGGVEQRLQSARLIENGAALELTWEGLRAASGATLDITFQGLVRRSGGGFLFSGSIANRSEYVIECVSWPCIGDLSMPEGALHWKRMNLSYAAMQTGELFPNFTANKGFYGIDHPLQMVATPEAPFVLMDAGSQGLYAGNHVCHAEQLVQFTWELKPGYERTDGFFFGNVPKSESIGEELVRTEFYTTHFPFLHSGESGDLFPIHLEPYQGTWHSGADCYRHWRKDNLQCAAPPAWAQEVHSWQQIHINSPEEEYRVPYRELTVYGDDCKRHGVAAIQLTGWNEGGQDRNNPSHDPEPRLGTWNELSDAIASVQENGVKMILFSKFTWADRAEKRFKDQLIQHALKDPFGDCFPYPGWQYQTPTQLSDINTRRLVPMCTADPGWREVCRDEFSKLLSLQAAGTLYDECQHHGGARYCFDPTHQHHVPAHVYGGDAPLAVQFREMIDARLPQFLLAGEACYDLELEHYSISYFRITADHVPLHRYVNPEAQMMIAVMGYNDRNTINQALLYRYILSYEPRNFKGRLEEAPGSLEYGKLMDAFRRRYDAYLWHAVCQDTRGADVTSVDRARFAYSVFASREHGKRAVVVANFADDEPIQVSAQLEPAAKLKCASPEEPELRAAREREEIPPLSALMFLEN